jgi:hypothetical protein
MLMVKASTHYVLVIRMWQESKIFVVCIFYYSADLKGGANARVYFQKEDETSFLANSL